MNAPKLDERLQSILNEVKGSTLADIGCDHGKLAINAVLKKGASKVVASDISKPSLMKTIKMVEHFHLENQIECRVGNGLEVLKSDEVETIVIAGMGGDLIEKILRCAFDENKKFKQYILSPHSHGEKVRKVCCDFGLNIQKDIFLEVAGKYYPIIVCENLGQTETLNDLQIQYGKFFETSTTFMKWAKNEILKIEKLKNQIGTNEKLDCELKKLLEVTKNDR